VDAVKVGPIHAQAKEVLDLLHDPTRCRVVLVTAPEETPVNELIETAYSLEDEVGVALGPVVVNGVLESLAGLGSEPQVAARDAGVQLLEGEAEMLRAAAEFRAVRTELQLTQLDRMSQDLPLPQLHLPYLFVTDLSRPELDTLAESLLDGVRGLPEPRPAP